ncbi:MAG: hypothetical protein AAFR38_00625 [Planctomycetota bacterium]
MVALAVTSGLACAQASLRALGDVPGGEFSSGAARISADDTTVVGTARAASGRRAFRWTLPSGLVEASGTCVSDDGSFAFGFGAVPSIWSRFRGIRTLEAVIADKGIALRRGRLNEALGISADGTRIVGTLENNLCSREAFLLTVRLRGCSGADIAAPTGVLSQADVDAFVSQFFQGCPL